jgi:HAD superfamily hydrolase (TIGR01549 family)
MIKGILFDVDGTLVLSNDAHAQAWCEAFAKHGFPAGLAAVRKLIGMGSDKLIEALYPEMNDEAGVADEIKQDRKQLFLTKYVPMLQPAPGARELVQAMQRAGLKTVVASSASSDELEALLRAAGVDDLLTETTTADDADNSKPDPDIIETALDKIGLPADDVLMIGDTPYDIEAAHRAGVRCVAVRCGGWDDTALRGADFIFDDPSDVQAHRTDIVASSP